MYYTFVLYFIYCDMHLSYMMSIVPYQMIFTHLATSQARYIYLHTLSNAQPSSLELH